MRPRSDKLTFLLSVLLLSTSLLYAQNSAPQSTAELARVLPLNHFPDSRLTNTDSQGFYQMPTGIGDDYFDGTDSVVRIRRHMQIANALGVKYLRCAFSWNGIEHKQGVYDWRFWDRLVDESERFGIRLIPYVAYTPEWAARSRIEYWKQPPRDPDLYAEFMEKVATRYRGRIRSWELWNEPDLREYWQGTPEEFAELIRRGAKAVRRADPNAVIVLGGMSLGPTPFFTRLIKEERIAAYVDVIAQHGYPESWHPQRAETIYYDWTGDMQELIKQYGFGVDFWLNEIGYPDYRYRPNNASRWGQTDVDYAYEHTRRYQGVFLFKSFVMALASGRPSITVWYRIDDFPRTERRLGEDLIHYHLGVVDEHGTPKPDYQAFQFFNRLFKLPTKSLDATSSTTRTKNSQSIVNLFERNDGHVIVVAWLRSSERNEVRDRSGMARDLRREAVSVKLPCREVPKVRYFDALGEAAQGPTRLTSSGQSVSLNNVQLRGDGVFVAVAQCVR